MGPPGTTEGNRGRPYAFRARHHWPWGLPLPVLFQYKRPTGRQRAPFIWADGIGPSSELYDSPTKATLVPTGENIFLRAQTPRP